MCGPFCISDGMGDCGGTMLWSRKSLMRQRGKSLREIGSGEDEGKKERRHHGERVHVTAAMATCSGHSGRAKQGL